MTNKVDYKELNEKIAMMEAVLRKQLNAPVALAPNATPEQVEEHVAATVEFLHSHDFSFTNNSMEEVLAVKVFDDAVTKACADHVAVSIYEMIEACLDTNQEVNNLYPFIDEYTCNVEVKVLLRHGLFSDIKTLYLQSFGMITFFDKSDEPEEAPVFGEECSDVAPAFDEEHVMHGFKNSVESKECSDVAPMFDEDYHRQNR